MRNLDGFLLLAAVEQAGSGPLMATIIVRRPEGGIVTSHTIGTFFADETIQATDFATARLAAIKHVTPEGNLEFE